MPTPPAAQDAPTWSSSSGGATSSGSASPSYSSDPSSSSPPAPVPSSSSAPSSSDPHAAPSSSDCRGTSAPSPSPPPPSCAACRHQRRKCPPHCLLKRYFVADEPDKFRNALRVFGVKNLQRMLQKVPPPRRDVCVQTIVYESNLRAADPVRGCCGVIQDLENQLMDTAVELEVLRRRLESYRQMARGSLSQPPNPLATQQQLMVAIDGGKENKRRHANARPIRRASATGGERAHRDTATIIREGDGAAIIASAATAVDDAAIILGGAAACLCHDSPRRRSRRSQRYSDNRQMRRQTARDGEAKRVIWLEKAWCC